MASSASSTEATSSEPTYEGLKLRGQARDGWQMLGSEPTYEGLKRVWLLSGFACGDMFRAYL